MFFERLNRLALQSPLVIAVTADPATGKMTLVITPKLGKDTSEAALRQPLALSATPAEFDREFYDVLERYSTSRQSLIEQAEATAEVLDAAKKAQVEKASKATARTSKPTAPKPTPAIAGEEEGEGGEAGQAQAGSGGTPAESAPANGGQGTSLFG